MLRMHTADSSLQPKNVLFDLGAAGLQTDTGIDTVRRPTARECAVANWAIEMT